MRVQTISKAAGSPTENELSLNILANWDKKLGKGALNIKFSHCNKTKVNPAIVRLSKNFVASFFAGFACRDIKLCTVSPTQGIKNNIFVILLADASITAIKYTI